MNTLQKSPPLREMVESYTLYRKAAGMKPLDRLRTLYLTPVITRKLKEYILRFHGASPDAEAYRYPPRYTR